VIAGLDEKTNEPFICGMDTIGAIETAKDFMVAGTAPDSLYGMCESMWQPDMVRFAVKQGKLPSHGLPSKCSCAPWRL
jgi:20S proteasome alpha/beta subunit